MRLPKADLLHLNSIVHEGKVVLFATTRQGQICYSIKQDGFEDNYNNTAVTGWENWAELAFPEEEEDPSVMEKEQEDYTIYDANGNEQYLLRSRYNSPALTAIAPVQLVSALQHIYVFRQSKAGSILCDRFVLDGLSNTLIRKLDVRFKRSRQKYQPLASNGNNLIVDAPDYRDVNNQPFYEPTTELSLIQQVSHGWFSVLLLPTNEQDKYRWHIFAHHADQNAVQLTSLRASAEGLFELQDDRVLEPAEDDPETLIPRSIPGVIQRTLQLYDNQQQPLTVSQGLTATAYDLQEEQETQAGPQLLKTATKVMLAIPTQQGSTVALSFSAAADGTLSEVDETPGFRLLRSQTRDLLMPLNTLDEIKGIGLSEPPPQGQIMGMEQAENDQVRIRSAQADMLSYGDVIQITDTQHYNGHYVAKRIDEHTFEIETQWIQAEVGAWEVLPEEETGLRFDGVITAYERTSDGNIRVSSPNHGLESGDEVQIEDTQDHDGTFVVTDVDRDRFSIGLDWTSGEAVNLKLQSRKRRGVSFDGVQDYIQTPVLDLNKPSESYSFGQTYSAWVYVSDRKTNTQVIVASPLMQLCMSQSRVKAKIQLAHEMVQVPDSDLLPENQWVHYACSFAYNHKLKQTTVILCRNGAVVGTQTFDGTPTLGENTSQQFWFAGTPEESYFAGKISDMQVWNEARSPRLTKDTMHLQLTGRELNLAGYWRLGGITEGKQRQVVDFSVNGQDATVYGDPFVSAITLNRQLRDNQTDVIKFSNDELVAVSQRATYDECFEFRLDDASIDPNDVEGAGQTLFNFGYWGTENPLSNERIEFTGEMADFEALGNGWYKAYAKFTVPDGIKLIRSFQLTNVAGTWKTLEIRKHRIRLLSDTITEATYQDELKLEALAHQNPGLDHKLSSLTHKELRELDLMAQKQKLQEELALLENEQGLQSEISKLEKTLTSLQKQRDSAHQRYRQEVSNPFNYYCKIINSYSRKAIEASGYSRANGAILGQYTSRNAHAQHWRFEARSNAYAIVNRHTGKAFDVVGQSTASGASINQWAPHSGRSQLWRFLPQGSNYLLFNLNSHKHVSIPDFSTKDSLLGQYVASGHASQQWRLESQGIQANSRIPDAYHHYNHLAQEHQRVTTQLAHLRRQLAARLAELERVRAALAAVKEALRALQTELITLNDQILAQVQASQDQSQSMAILHQDNRGLLTQGSILNFVRPASRLSSLASSEGNVQLIYFDDRGRMRQTRYDATSDRANTVYEAWLPDVIKSCLYLQHDNSTVTLEDPVPLAEDWTLEAWFSYPLPETQTHNTLIASTGNDQAISIQAGKILGVVIQNEFHPAQFEMGEGEMMDVSLESLSPGWHHIAAVGSGSGEDAKTAFYLNGQVIGTVAKKSQEAIAMLGNSPQGNQPFGKITELRVWALALSPEEVEINSRSLLTGNEPGLVTYYPTNEATGTQVRDFSGNNRHGALQNIIWWACGAPIGNPGHHVMQFDDAADQIQIPHHAKFNTTDGLTLEAWVKPKRLDRTWQPILQYSQFSQAKQPYGLHLHSSGAIHARINGEDMGIHGAGSINLQAWHHVAVTWSAADQTAYFYIDGEQVGSQPSQASAIDYANSYPLFIGSNANKQEYLDGRIAEVRVWKRALTQAEISAKMHHQIEGNDSGLIGYWPLDELDIMAEMPQTRNLSSAELGEVSNVVLVQDNDLPISPSALIAGEYSTIGLEPNTDQKMALMRRFLAIPELGEAKVFADQRVEQLELQWIGNAQFAPTLLGYMEGPPPMPSENLTIEEDYNGATAVELSQSEDVEYKWSRSSSQGVGAKTEFFAGAEDKSDAGIAITKQIAAARAGVKGGLDLNYSKDNSSNISSQSSQTNLDRLEVRGSQENTAAFDHLGQRFIPKNIGYALVVSALADVFVTRLKRTQRMVGYQVHPVEGVPLDVNTITFLMNPAYTMAGSLDGLTGSQASSDRFHRHVPEMRAQYGSLYPASYYRLQEAYDLKQQLENEDTRRQAFFAHFNATLIDEASLDRQVNSGSAPSETGVNRAENQPGATEEERRQAEEAESAQFESDTQAQQDQQSEATAQQETEIASNFENRDQQTQATESFAAWQRRLEDLQIRAGKRNIVNTYVWDADGGLRTEAQSFASTVEHTVGGSFSLNAALGAEGKFNVAGATVELSAQATFSLNQTLSKTESTSTGFELNVDLGGVESRQITDHNDLPLLPGEKVDRYRFMSFYLEGNTRHFHDFFDYVVDPEWLRSNDEEARALRQTMTGKPNKAWRVLHRVTYVERPALMGFGRDIRTLPQESQKITSNTELLSRISELEEDNQALEYKLDEILAVLRSPNSPTVENGARLLS